ncbi:MAG: tRNA (guanosine(46)-N7)-methyltransferase TrmB [Flavobacteriales bacterium]|nr:tRNA (guanosine(46)-N7)-methyltransferase TrmB [Flavobacteriales bacterium]|tara:strand:+ start:768 stop:1439 length:672 start_codon:yes stop_codon:yes gene_type:complete
MGKDKLKRFYELNTFTNVLQPSLNEIKPAHKIKGKWNLEFKNDNPIVLELGCGKGEYTVGLAKLNPDINFIGVDIKGARIWRGAKTTNDENIENVRFLRTKIDFIDHFFTKDEVSDIWLTFSDPQPKRPRKRLTSPLFIDRYKKILCPNGIIHLKTDSNLLYHYTLDEIKENNYKIIENSDNIYSELIPRASEKLKETLSIQTFYESLWLKENKTIKYIAFVV